MTDGGKGARAGRPGGGNAKAGRAKNGSGNAKAGRAKNGGVNERELALEILLLVTRDGVHSHLALSDVLGKYQYLEKKSRAFISCLVQGTLERMLEMDYVIDRFSKTPVKKMKPLIRCILRSGVYQILYMDGVRDAAACDEAVRLAVKKGFSGLKGFVNGVLRAVCRAKDAGVLSYPDEEASPEEYLSVCCSIPPWLVQRWVADYGYADAKQICLMSLQKKPTAVRVSTARISVEELKRELSEEGISVRESGADGALLIDGYDFLGKIPAFVRGDFYVQDISSVQAVQAAGIKPGWNIIDVCAAPGGKAVYAAQLAGERGRVLARDLTAYKTALIEENRERCHADNLSVEVWDATVPDDGIAKSADLVIADLPCSGLGVLRGKPDIKYNMSPEQMRELAALQREILSVVQAYVKPGGRFLYSTCTISRMENEDNAAWFLQAFPGFSLVCEEQLFPDETRDGFYFAVFEERGHGTTF